MSQRRVGRLFKVFPRQPKTFGDWFIIFFPLSLIYPFLWRLIEERAWAGPTAPLKLLVLLIVSVGEALLFSLVFWFWPIRESGDD